MLETCGNIRCEKQRTNTVLVGNVIKYSEYKLKRIHGKNDFAKASKDLAKCRSENYIGHSSMMQKLSKKV